MTAVVDVNSPTLLIRDGLLAHIKSIPPFVGSIAKYQTVPRFTPVQPEDIPYLGLYLVEEKIGPDGDFNHAEPRTTHRATIGFSYIIQNNDAERAEELLDAGYWSLLKMFHFRDWHRLSPDAQIESVSEGVRTHHYGTAGLDNETPIAEMRMELTYLYRWGFEPIIDDVLDHVQIKLVYPWPEDLDVPPTGLQLGIPTP